MPKIITKEVTYKNYGKCLEISNGAVCALITADVGPRIIKYAFCDGENILFEDVERKLSESEALAPFGGGTWYIYGGHRLWTSPEAMPRSYYPDNDPVSYEITDGGFLKSARVLQSVTMNTGLCTRKNIPEIMKIK